MKIVLPLLAALTSASPVMAQGLGQSVSVDIGLGAGVRPSYPGSDETKVVPWLILRNFKNGSGGTQEAQGFSFGPSFNLIDRREAGDHDRLNGMDDISRAYEGGLRLGYTHGPATAYATMRKGFGGHHGVTGEVGAKYRIDATDRFTFWAGLEAGYGNDRFNDTYFGVTADEAARTDYAAFAPGSGFNSAAATLEGRFSLTDNTALLGQLRLGRIIGDAADSPVVADKSQNSVRLGIVRTLTFGF
ncbi:MAG: MipA/OmpV family protein [Paracoccus sp. (in: a-proteobacteria)]|nr:MipA/OmpV family protein [Paracoccus sp. (in: a-proteobacteria)]